MTHTVHLSARLATLEANVAELHELRRQRDELNLEIESKEHAEQVLAEVQLLLLPLLGGKEPQPVPAIPDVPHVDEEPATEAVETEEVQEEEVQDLVVQEPAEQEAEPPELVATAAEEPDAEDGEPYRSVYTITAEWVRAQSLKADFAASDVADETGTKEVTVKYYLRQLEKEGEIERIVLGGQRAFRYRRVAPDAPQVTPAASKPPVASPVVLPSEDAPLTPIPAKLSTDECSLFDALRKVPGGMSLRLLQARLNWGTNRVTNVMQRLVDAGHVGRNGELFRVFPEELRDALASD